MDGCAQRLQFSFLYITEPKWREWFHPQWACFPTSINMIKIILTDILRR